MSLTRRRILRDAVGAGASLFAFLGVSGLLRLVLGAGASSYPVDGGTSGSLDGCGTTAGDALLPRLIRPPGALEEPAFLAGCIRCYRCQDACDIGAVRFLGEGAGESFLSPYIDPAAKACNLCMKCTRSCPTGVLVPMEPEERREVSMATVTLEAALCLSHKAASIRDRQALLVEAGREATEVEATLERRGPCGECYMFCPERGRAIDIQPGGFLAPRVFPDKCVGCGLCEEICRVILRGRPAIQVVPTRSWT